MAIEEKQAPARPARDRDGAEHEALLRVANACAGANRLDDVLDIAADEARRAVGAASLSIGRFDRAAGLLRILINVGDLGPGESSYPEDESYRLDEYELLGRLLDGGEPYFNSVDDDRCDPAQGELLRELGKSSDLGVPVVVEGRIWGEIWSAKAVGEPPFTAADVSFLELIAGQVATAIGRAEMFSRVSRLAYEDALTGLPNRRALEERLERTLTRSAGTGRGVAMLVCDLDELKKLNDTRGHAAGDRAIQTAARGLVECTAELPRAFVSRLAGDEFCVLLEGSDLFEAVAVGSRAVERLGEASPEPIRLSAGAAIARPGQGSGSELLRAADSALYAAKRRGGGRVCSVAETVQGALDPATPESPTVGRGRLDNLVEALSARLDGPLAAAGALDRLEAVAATFMLSWNFASWAISIVPQDHEVIIDVANGYNRDAGEYLGMRFAPGAEVYPLADYPASAALIEAGQGSFTASREDPESDPAERAMLEEMRFESVIAAVASDHDGVYMVELFADKATAVTTGAEAALRLLAVAAMPPRTTARTDSMRAARLETAELIRDQTASLALADDPVRAALSTAERLAECFDAHVVHVVRLEGTQLRLEAEAGRVRTAPGWSQDAEAGLIGRCLREGGAVVASDVLREPQYRGTEATRGVRSELVVPILASGRVWGAVNVEQLEPDAFARHDVSLVEAFAAQLGARLGSIELYDNLDDAYLGTAEALSAALEAKHAYTAQHSRSIAENAAAAGARLGINGEELRMLRYAAAFHDIGKLAIPESVLDKPGPLDPGERALIERHTIIGERILAPVSFLGPALPIVRHAHERWDGAGYPDRLAATEIPLGARIVFACDAYDAMTSDRSYRAAMCPAEARAELTRGAGSQFDPDVVAALLAVLAERD